MSTTTNRETRTYGAVLGWQAPVRGTLASNTGTVTINDIAGNAKASQQALAGAAALAAGTYYFFLDTSGAGAVDLTVNLTHTSTLATMTLYKTLTDRVTEKLDASGGTTNRVTVNPSDSTQSTYSITNLRGEQGCMFKVVVPGGATVTFTVAEYSAG